MGAATICGRPLVPGESPLTKDNPNLASWLPLTEIDERDAKCADNWVPREKSLIRLTGKHPFNSEPPHADVMAAGWLTPVSKHFVRNHGAVPRLEWSTHRINIGGMVDKPISLSMDDLMKLPQVTVPVLLTCCGNRRKEVNMVKNSQGFSWGPGAVSVNHWTGVRLSDVLKLAGVHSHAQGARQVCFEGPKGELPKGDDGAYGTSMLLSKALDPSQDVLIAFKQNGQFLHPDHGFPCRMLIPGWIGGRMVKWLTEITVTAEESQNWYHWHDNKILPPHVTAEIAAAEGWWKNPDFLLTELNVNSTISAPAHDERVYLDKNQSYTMQGYAYSGGGRKITRVECSFDGGVTFSKPCTLKITEDPSPHGKYWTWIHWTLEVTTSEFLNASEIHCRAYDYAQNTQPAQLTWSLLGQGNNSMFKLKLHKEVDAEGRFCVRFQQPAPMLPGVLGNVGWREEEKEKEAIATAPPAAVTVTGLDETKRYVTRAMLERHTEDDSIWFEYQGQVFDGTPFLKDHPGGADSMLMVGGEDATEDFNAVHSDAAKKQLLDYYIAEMAPDGVTVPPALLYEDDKAPGAALVSKVEDDVFLNPKKAKKSVLLEKKSLSHDVVQFKFGLDREDQKLGLPTGKHMLLRVYAPDKEGKQELVMRAYTPTTADETLGCFYLVVKIYFANVHPRFPDGGRMSQLLNGMSVGDSLEVKGPIGHFHYQGQGKYLNHKELATAKRINMIAGGTGITPMYQVMKNILSDPEDTTEMRLLYANQTENDILVRSEMEGLAKDFPDRFKLQYTVDRPPEVWPHCTGFINEEMCRNNLFEYEEGTITVLCGPPPMLQYACHPNLEKMGFTKGTTAIEF